MYAIEFETELKGNHIELPFALSTDKSMVIRVILMSEQKIDNAGLPKSSFNCLTTFAKGKKIAEFHREDAYRDGI